MAPPPRRGSGECAVPPLEIGVQAIQLSPYRAGLAGRHRTRLPMTPAFPTCSCPLRLSPSGKSMTQEFPFELLLTVSRMQHRVPRRTLSPHPAQHLQISLGLRSVTKGAEYLQVGETICIPGTFELCARLYMIYFYLTG